MKNNILAWASNKGLLKPENSLQQCLKTVSEVGELADALIKGNKEEFIDAIGDVYVTLVILCKQQGVDIDDCIESAYNQIKNRTGVTVNGTFIKDEL